MCSGKMLAYLNRLLSFLILITGRWSNGRGWRWRNATWGCCHRSDGTGTSLYAHTRRKCCQSRAWHWLRRQHHLQVRLITNENFVIDLCISIDHLFIPTRIVPPGTSQPLILNPKFHSAFAIGNFSIRRLSFRFHTFCFCCVSLIK